MKVVVNKSMVTAKKVETVKFRRWKSFVSHSALFSACLLTVLVVIVPSHILNQLPLNFSSSLQLLQLLA